jgi:hypothetical protein
VVLTLLAIIVAGVVAVALYQGGWWLNKNAENHRADIRRSGFEQQTTYRDEIVRKIADVRAIDQQITESTDDTAQLQAQRKAIVNIICRDNTHIQGGLDSDSAQFVQEEC